MNDTMKTIILQGGLCKIEWFERIVSNAANLAGARNGYCCDVHAEKGSTIRQRIGTVTKAINPCRAWRAIQASSGPERGGRLSPATRGRAAAELLTYAYRISKVHASLRDNIEKMQ